MKTEILMPEFEQLADIFWRLGVMQSPSHLHGYSIGLLVSGDVMEPEQWLRLATTFIDAVEPPNESEKPVLLSLYAASQFQLQAGDMGFQLLLPEDEVEVTLRVDALGQWCQGFLAGFAQGGKQIQQLRGQQQYSEDVSEAIRDIAAISQVNLSESDDDQETREQNMVEIIEYLRVAIQAIYLECQHREPEDGITLQGVASKDVDKKVTSPQNLFGGAPAGGKGKNKLH